MIKFLNNIKQILKLIIFIITSCIFIHNFFNKNKVINLKSINNTIKNKNIKNKNIKNKNIKRNVSESKKKQIASNQVWKCNICKNILDYTYQIDHINPLFKGGNNEMYNLQALCPNCHMKKTYTDKI